MGSVSNAVIDVCYANIAVEVGRYKADSALTNQSEVVVASMPDTSVSVAGIKLAHPVMLASGILGLTADTMRRAEEGGAAAVVTKSFSLEPRSGHENPTVAIFPHGIINAMGLPNPGAEVMAKEIMAARKKCRVPVIASVFGDSATSIIKACTIAEEAGAMAVELNLSCPHVSGVGMDMGSDKNAVKTIVADVASVLSRPLFVKVTPHVPRVEQLALAAVEGNADAIVAINTVRSVIINPYMRAPELAAKFGGYSGPGIKPVGLYCVYRIYEAVGNTLPIIGVGGITTGLDAVEYLMAGATAVQVGSAIYYRGYDVFAKISSEISEFMKNEGYEKINDIIGIVAGEI